MMADALVSVIIPVYNGAKFLPDAIATIDAQQYRPIEIIVVDDGSTDETAQVVARYGDRLQYHYQENQGPAAARNLGLQVAQGDYIAFLDVDDQWPALKLVHQLQAFVDNPSLEIVNGYVQVMQAVPGESQAFQERFAPIVSFNLGSALFRRAVFETVGYFDARQIHSEDVDWFMHARELGVAMVVLEEVTLLYRKHQDNLTHNRQENLQGFLQALRKSIHRRQQGNPSVQPLAQLNYLDATGHIHQKESPLPVPLSSNPSSEHQ